MLLNIIAFPDIAGSGKYDPHAEACDGWSDVAHTSVCVI